MNEKNESLRRRIFLAMWEYNAGLRSELLSQLVGLRSPRKIERIIRGLDKLDSARKFLEQMPVTVVRNAMEEK